MLRAARGGGNSNLAAAKAHSHVYVCIQDFCKEDRLSNQVDLACCTFFQAC